LACPASITGTVSGTAACPSLISRLRDVVNENFTTVVFEALRIFLIILFAVLLRWVLRRGINRFARGSSAGDLPLLLRPLGERLDVHGFLTNAGLLSERRRQRAETIASIMRSIVSIMIVGIAGMIVLGELNVSLAPVLASAGVLGLALGFGAQNLVKDFVAGVFMILEDQYGVGDVIKLGEISGTVEGVGLRTTRLRDDHGTVWYVRNGEVDQVGNKSQGYAQVVLDTPVPRGVSIDAYGEAIKAAADGLWQDEDWNSAVVEEPQLLGIEQFTDTREPVLRLTMRTRPLQQWRVARELRRRVRDRVDAVRHGADDTPSGAT
jgi:moderate conductance mechanosensitive channel